MFNALDASGPLSRFARNLALWSVALTLVFSLADAVLHGLARSYEYNPPQIVMWAALAYDLRYLFEQLIYVGTLLFIGAKFFETRTILTVGFANLDRDKVRLRGPDEENVVWVGHRYGTRMEAEAMSAALQNRLNVSTSDA